MIRNLLLVSSAMLLGGCNLLDSARLPIGDSLATPATNGEVSLDAKSRADFAVATGRLAEDEGDTSRAMKLFSEAAVLDPENADAHWRMAIVFSGLQQVDDANAAFEKALRINPSNGQLNADYGYHLYLQNRFEEAEETLRTATRLRKDDPRTLNNLGLVLAAMGREQEAVEMFLDSGCSRADARSNVAFVQAMGHNFERARFNYQQALVLDPSQAQSAQALEQLNKLVMSDSQAGLAGEMLE